jgi:hypothetical protein
MPKTYTAAGSAVAGDVYTAAAHNVIVTDVNNFIVPPACRVTRTTQQTIANNTLTALNFTATASYDTDGMVGATTTFVTVQTAGIYLVTACIGWGAVAAGIRALYLRLNPTLTGTGDSTVSSGGTGVGGILLSGVGNTGSETSISTSGVYSFSASDKIVAAVFQTSGGNLNTDNAAGTHLSLTWLGRTA